MTVERSKWRTWYIQLLRDLVSRWDAEGRVSDWHEIKRRRMTRRVLADMERDEQRAKGER